MTWTRFDHDDDLDAYMHGDGEPPDSHPDCWEERQQEEDYLRRYADCEVAPVRVSDDFEPTDLDALREDLELFARAVSMPSIRKKAA